MLYPNCRSEENENLLREGFMASRTTIYITD